MRPASLLFNHFFFGHLFFAFFDQLICHFIEIFSILKTKIPLSAQLATGQKLLPKQQVLRRRCGFCFYSILLAFFGFSNFTIYYFHSPIL
mgnify:FL=1